MRDTAGTAPTTTLRGILRWDDLDRLWKRVTGPGGAPWYLYRAGDEPSRTPASARELAAFVAEVDTVVRREHREEYCGVVYADDPSRPSYVKIYHPRGMGSSCALPGHAVPATWILSRLGPVVPAPLPPARRGLVERLFGARR